MMLISRWQQRKCQEKTKIPVDHNIPQVTVMVCHGVADTMDNHIPQVTVMVCHGIAKSDTITVTITTVTKILRYHLHLGYTLNGPIKDRARELQGHRDLSENLNVLLRRERVPKLIARVPESSNDSAMAFGKIARNHGGSTVLDSKSQQKILMMYFCSKHKINTTLLFAKFDSWPTLKLGLTNWKVYELTPLPLWIQCQCWKGWKLSDKGRENHMIMSLVLPHDMTMGTKISKNNDNW